jgi:hypothetical protein
MNRRMLLRGLLALPFVPLATKVAAAIELTQPSADLPIFGQQGFALPQFSDVISCTIESRSKEMADNIYKNNALLAVLKKSTRIREFTLNDRWEEARATGARTASLEAES